LYFFTAAAATAARWVVVNWGFPTTVAAVCELGLRSSFWDWWLLLLLLLMPDGEKSSAIREVVGATDTHTETDPSPKTDSRRSMEDRSLA
jgi:hypothetical protein